MSSPSRPVHFRHMLPVILRPDEKGQRVLRAEVRGRRREENPRIRQ